MDMLKGMNMVLNYIEENLDNHIDLKEVAKRAYCSEYHFKRLFSLLSGITLSEYIRRRRLTVAALELKDKHVKVIDIVFKYGYQSPDAFSRAFQSFHGVIPTLARNPEQNLKAYLHPSPLDTTSQALRAIHTDALIHHENFCLFLEFQ